jgi:signal peptidase I
MYLKNSCQNNQTVCNLEPIPVNLSSDEATSIFQDILNREISLRVKVTGKSMASFLNGGEILTIRKVPSSSLHIGDLIFYKTRQGIPVLHRILEKERCDKSHIFKTKGDALLSLDEPVYESDILGKVCRIESDSDGRRKYINMESRLWRNINYLLAVINIGKSKTYPVLRRNTFYSLFRRIIKKVLT